MIQQESYASSPNGDESLHSEDISQEMTEPSKPENLNLQQRQDRLSQRVKNLTRVLVGAVLLMMGSLIWITYQLQSQARLVRQSDTVSTATEVLNRLTDVEQQLQTLAEKTPEDLLTQVQTNRTQLETISSQLKQIGGNAQSLQNLTDAVRALTGEQVEPVTSAQPPSTQSELAPSEVDSSEEEVTP
ncbi:MAG: hypothetical protein QNJ46_16625 [Leptolyngbyaceae cyanobacterium MO_188.B28]|nr:hypothetical protein [Leptolyngbyaceae cyanobacterium MO_188.B28]